MKKFIVLAAIFLFLFQVAFPQSGDIVTGSWLNDDKDAKVEIYRSGDKYFGKITWTKNMYEADGKTLKKDIKNPNEQMRVRTIVNMIILSGFVYEDGEWTGGEIYDPKTGKTYKSKMKLKGNNLEVRGYIGSPVFGKSTVLTKAS